MHRVRKPTDLLCTCRRYCTGARWRSRQTYHSREHVNEREYDRAHPEWWLHGDRHVPSDDEDQDMEDVPGDAPGPGHGDVEMQQVRALTELAEHLLSI
jgi:hypothetical protein